MRPYLIFVSIICISFSSKSQHSFTGHVDNERWHNNVYLSVIEDYRKISGVYSEQIIAKVKTDETGYFKFSGNQLENEHRIYRIHVDNCNDDEQNRNHFSGYCNDSKAILFIAKNNDSIVFPFSFENEMFCDIKSTNTKASAFVKIDSLKEDMKFAFGEFRSEANRKLNTKKWFKTLQDFGKQLHEPIAELYIYSFLSDRSNNLHEYYLKDLKTNNYYEDLLERLSVKYPNSPYTKQYKSEITSDKFIISEAKESWLFWIYILMPLLIISVLLNIYFALNQKKILSKSSNTIKSKLTKQEQKILQLLLEDNSNKAIAETLFVSLSTVKTHVNNIYKKLNVQSREEIKALFIK